MEKNKTNENTSYRIGDVTYSVGSTFSSKESEKSLGDRLSILLLMDMKDNKITN